MIKIKPQRSKKLNIRIKKINQYFCNRATEKPEGGIKNKINLYQKIKLVVLVL